MVCYWKDFVLALCVCVGVGFADDPCQWFDGSSEKRFIIGRILFWLYVVVLAWVLWMTPASGLMGPWRSGLLLKGFCFGFTCLRWRIAEQRRG